VADQVGADYRVRPDLCPLVLVDRAGLVEDASRHLELADVVELARETQALRGDPRDTQLMRGHRRVPADHSSVRGELGIGRGEPFGEKNHLAHRDGTRLRAYRTW